MATLPLCALASGARQASSPPSGGLSSRKNRGSLTKIADMIVPFLVFGVMIVSRTGSSYTGAGLVTSTAVRAARRAHGPHFRLISLAHCHLRRRSFFSKKLSAPFSRRAYLFRGAINQAVIKKLGDVHPDPRRQGQRTG